MLDDGSGDECVVDRSTGGAGTPQQPQQGLRARGAEVTRFGEVVRENAPYDRG